MILQNDASLIGGVVSGLACDATFFAKGHISASYKFAR